MRAEDKRRKRCQSRREEHRREDRPSEKGRGKQKRRKQEGKQQQQQSKEKRLQKEPKGQERHFMNIFLTLRSLSSAAGPRSCPNLHRPAFQLVVNALVRSKIPLLYCKDLCIFPFFFGCFSEGSFNLNSLWFWRMILWTVVTYNAGKSINDHIGTILETHNRPGSTTMLSPQAPLIGLAPLDKLSSGNSTALCKGQR